MILDDVRTYIIAQCAYMRVGDIAFKYHVTPPTLRSLISGKTTHLPYKMIEVLDKEGCTMSITRDIPYDGEMYEIMSSLTNEERKRIKKYQKSIKLTTAQIMSIVNQMRAKEVNPSVKCTSSKASICIDCGTECSKWKSSNGKETVKGCKVEPSRTHAGSVRIIACPQYKPAARRVRIDRGYDI